MARTAKIAKTQKKPKFKTRTRNRCRVCGRARGYIRKPFTPDQVKEHVIPVLEARS